MYAIILLVKLSIRQVKIARENIRYMDGPVRDIRKNQPGMAGSQITKNPTLFILDLDHTKTLNLLEEGLWLDAETGILLDILSNMYAIQKRLTKTVLLLLK
jgi:hypothetical protein